GRGGMETAAEARGRVWYATLTGGSMAQHDLVERAATSASVGLTAPHGMMRATSNEPVDGVVCRLGDSSCAAAHAGAIGRARSGQQTSLQRSLLQLQRQYGNHYVGQVLRAGDGGVFGDLDGVERSIGEARGGGHGLDHHTQNRMEQAFGVDFTG